MKISAENLHFFQADYYYRRGIPGVSALSKNDIKRMEDYLLEIKPSVIFFAAENDPHGAHGLSTELIVKALQGEKATAWHQQNQLKFMGYRGAYNEWSLNHPEDLLIIPFDQAQMNLKEKAIKEHISQLDPVFPSFDPDPFYIRARKRNRDVMVQLKEIGMVKKDSSLHYAEVFRIFGDEFLKIYG